jgi:hypothetical protein
VDVETRVIAFVRHLERGGKPEFIGVSRIRGRWADIENVVGEAERDFTEGHVILDVRALGVDGASLWMAENGEKASYALRSAWEFFVMEHSRQNSTLPGWAGI